MISATPSGGKKNKKKPLLIFIFEAEWSNGLYSLTSCVCWCILKTNIYLFNNDFWILQTQTSVLFSFSGMKNYLRFAAQIRMVSAYLRTISYGHRCTQRLVSDLLPLSSSSVVWHPSFAVPSSDSTSGSLECPLLHLPASEHTTNIWGDPDKSSSINIVKVVQVDINYQVFVRLSIVHSIQNSRNWTIWADSFWLFDTKGFSSAHL